MSNRQLTVLASIGTGAIAFALSAVLSPMQGNIKQVIAQEPTLEDVADDTDQYLGQTVTIRGAVEELESGLSFTIKDEDLFGAIDDEKVLVINRTGALLPVRPDEDIEIQVTGQVGEFITSEAEDIFGLDLSLGIYDEYENQAVVYADSVALSPSPDEIFEEPEAYYYKRVAVKGEVENVLGANVFSFEDDDLTDQVIGSDQMLVVNVAPGQLPESDEEIIVTGTIRPFVLAELESAYGLSLSDLEADYIDQPVLVADGVYVVDAE